MISDTWVLKWLPRQRELDNREMRFLCDKHIVGLCHPNRIVRMCVFAMSG